MISGYVPRRGDIVWLDFNPQSGHEQAGRRPALVLSEEAYNRKARLMLCCPMTSQVKGYPFEVQVKGIAEGVVLADQIKSMDWKERHADYKGKASSAVLREVLAKARALLSPASS